MALRISNKLGLRLLQEVPLGFLAPIYYTSNVQFVRHRRTKHWDPKFKFLRRMKVMKIDLPNYSEKMEDLTEEELRARMKEQGLLPSRPWMETQHYLGSTGGIFEPYVPPEGDGVVSPVSMQGAKQKIQFLEKKSKTMMAVRKIRSFEEDFDTPEFCAQAEKIYIKMHECMGAKDKEKLIDYVTERAYPEVIHNINNKTIVWKFIKNVELPRVVHARCTDIITKENIFAQLTVRFHTQQILAIYDRFGRLMHGSEILAKDVLEYVVFEKHLANEYGVWRVHDKIIPDWSPPRPPSLLTFKKAKKLPPSEPDKALVETSSDKEVQTHSTSVPHTT